jgi:hypothetical protein
MTATRSRPAVPRLADPVRIVKEQVFGINVTLPSAGLKGSGLGPSARGQDCNDPARAYVEARITAAALYDPRSLVLRVTTSGLATPDGSVRALVDSGATHCFIDPRAITPAMHRTRIPPTELRLFDGSSNCVITEAVTLRLRFAGGQEITQQLLLARLDGHSQMVLGYDWLHTYNPLIDWVQATLTFRPREPSSATASNPDISASAATVNPADDPDRAPPTIALVSAQAFLRAQQSTGSRTYKVSLAPSAAAKLRGIREDYPTSEPSDIPGLPPEYADFADVFSEARSNVLAPHRPYDLKIDLEDGAEITPGHVYSLSPSELKAICEFLDEHLNYGFIRPSSSTHGAPVLFVKKKDGSLRLCVDFRRLNKITKKDRYPLPLISDLLDIPRRAKRYTKIDLRHAYHLVRIAEGDEWKTAFRTRYGSFEWQVMPFGLTNAPAAFQWFMNTIFADLLDVTVICYLDDILVYSEDPVDHTEHVREVLRRLRKHGLYARADKCEFGVESVEYLGFFMSPDGLTMDSKKVQAISDWPTPRKVKDVQSFLGFANFYRRFIHNYSDITIPLTRLTRKTTPFVWSSACESAFTRLKTAFTRAPILVHWQPDHHLVVETDASDYAAAAVLSMHCDDGELRPVAFMSRSFKGAELNYDVHDKELLAIYDAFRGWRHYLEGTPETIDVVTDHKNLEYFSTTKILTRRQARWSEYLSAFNMVVCFRPGKLGGKPDATSIPVKEKPTLRPTRRTVDRSSAGHSSEHQSEPRIWSRSRLESPRSSTRTLYTRSLPWLSVPMQLTE